MAQPKTNLVAILVLLLLLVVAGSAAVLWFLPGAEPAPVSPAPPSSLTPDAGSAVFNLRLFDRGVYQTLNLKLVSDGSLPVKPPASAGKANPFL